MMARSMPQSSRVAAQSRKERPDGIEEKRIPHRKDASRRQYDGSEGPRLNAGGTRPALLLSRPPPREHVEYNAAGDECEIDAKSRRRAEASYVLGREN